MKTPETGEFVPSPDGKKKIKSKVRFEEFSDWRSELGEGVMPAAIDPKAHRKQQRAAKVRNLAQKGATLKEKDLQQKERPKVQKCLVKIGRKSISQIKLMV